MHFTLPYERQGHSQFGETGIIELLLAGLQDPHQTFVEIGFGTGNQNMTMDLLDRGYRGIGVDARDWEPDTPNRWGDAITKLKQMIIPDDIVDVLRPVADWNTDFFSLDIDSFDYDIAYALLQAGFRPAVVCVEINKHFGPITQASFPYIANARKKTYDRRYFCGASLSKYTKLWEHHGMKFFTLNSISNHNAFYYDPARVTIPNVPVLSQIDVELQDIKTMIQEHWCWKDHEQTIYKDFE
jgi:hypothetical protein